MWVSGVGCRVRVQDVGCRVSGFGSRVEGVCARVWTCLWEGAISLGCIAASVVAVMRPLTTPGGAEEEGGRGKGKRETTTLQRLTKHVCARTSER